VFPSTTVHVKGFQVSGELAACAGSFPAAPYCGFGEIIVVICSFVVALGVRQLATAFLQGGLMAALQDRREQAREKLEPQLAGRIPRSTRASSRKAKAAASCRTPKLPRTIPYDKAG